MNKSRKNLLIVGLIIIVALLVAIVLLKPAQKPANISNGTETNNQVQTNEPATPQNVTASQQDQFRNEVPADVKVPSVNEKLTDAQKKEIAVPTVVTPAAPGVTTQFRSFNISGDQGKFFPSKIIGRMGDTMHINFTASDKDYDIVFPSYNMKATARKGETKVLEFQAVQEGDFTFYCQLCGGLTSGTTGHVIITK